MTLKTCKQPKLPVHHRLIRDMSNEAYHGVKGTWSSTQFKTILEDEEVFIQTYIKGNGVKVEGEALDTGTYFHTGVLEPHKVHSEVVVYTGKLVLVRTGSLLRISTKANVLSLIDRKSREMG